MTALRRFITGGCIAWALVLPARAEVEHTTLALPAIAFIFSTAYIADDAGIFKGENLDVKQQVITGIGATNAVISGSVDFAFASGVTLTRAAARNQPVIAIATTYDRTGFWVVVSKKIAEERHFDPKAPLAERAKIMKGLRFGVGAIQAIPHAYLKLIAKIGGLDAENDIVVAGIAPPDTVAARERGAIDGFSGGPPVVEQALRDGAGVVVADGTTGAVDPPSLAHIDANVLLTRPQTCVEHRSLCVKMGHAMVQANVFMHEHPEEAMALLGKRLNVGDKAVLAEAYKHTMDSTPSPPLSDAKGLAAADELNVEAGFMKAEEKLSSYDKFFTNEFVK
jgi:ABC-type nitrate/sulfonate/bicarbonate transport system substrate-binding protein